MNASESQLSDAQLTPAEFDAWWERYQVPLLLDLDVDAQLAMRRRDQESIAGQPEVRAMIRALLAAPRHDQAPVE